MGRAVERPAYHELEPDIVAGFVRTFINRSDRYPLQLHDGSYVTVEEPLTMAMVEAHIRGTRTIGAYALDAQSMAKWLCFDADGALEWYGLCALHACLADQNMPSYLETSRRGGHLWLFLEPLPGREARRFGKHLLAEHNLTGLELFPKQDQLHTGPGSLVRLPLGVHRKSGRRYPFVSSAGKPLAPTVREQLLILANPERITYSAVTSLLRPVQDNRPAPPLHDAAPLKDETPSARIKNAIGVFDFVSQYVELDQEGRGLCPFHADHRASFSVSQDGNYWYCFARCGGGSIIDFWMKWRAKNGQDSSFKATITDLTRMLL